MNWHNEAHTHLGDFGKSPYSGISDAGYIQNFHLLQENKDKDDDEKKGENWNLPRALEAAKQVWTSTHHWGKLTPQKQGRQGKMSWQAS